MNLDDLTRTSGEWLRGTGPESDIVMCSRIRLARNLNDFPFINRASRLERTEIEAVVRGSLTQVGHDLSFLRRRTTPASSTDSSSSSRQLILAASPSTTPKAPGGWRSPPTRTSRS